MLVDAGSARARDSNRSCYTAGVGKRFQETFLARSGELTLSSPGRPPREAHFSALGVTECIFNAARSVRQELGN